jgi:predicted Zn-dependent peptidase
MVSFNCAMPAESLDKALALYAEIVLTPHLPEDQLDDAKQMSLQELRGIDDDPVQRLMIRLRELQYGPRLGRSPYGTVSSIEQTTLRHIRSFYNDHYHGGGAILGIAGRLDPDQVLSRVESLFSPLRNSVPTDQTSPVGTPGYEHIESDLSQTHIGISFDSLPYGHVDYFKRRAAIGILSDGASSRLFDRVREQRGLCYTVSASSHSVRHGGGVFVYAGTTPERAQETLDVTIHELEHFADSIGVDELDRWRVRVESNLIMEQESSVSKASSLVADQFQMGRVVTIREVESIIGSLTVDAIRDQWLNQPPANYRIVTIGQSPLNVP